MKKSYITPSIYCIKISTNAIIAGSLDALEIQSTETPVDRGAVWTKENNSVWDEEW